MSGVNLEDGAEGLLRRVGMSLLEELFAEGEVLGDRLLRIQAVGLLSLRDGERRLNNRSADDKHQDAGAPERTDVQTSSRARLRGDRDHELFLGLRVR
mgnify:CR=1 FL=1